MEEEAEEEADFVEADEDADFEAEADLVEADDDTDFVEEDAEADFEVDAVEWADFEAEGEAEALAELEDLYFDVFSEEDELLDFSECS